MPGMLEHALSLAERGFYVFPCEENGKKPQAGCKWRQDSSRKPATIRAWWEATPKANIGADCGKSKIYVIDIDCKEGKQGEKTFAELESLHGRNPTLVAHTPSGGRHLIYSAEQMPNTAEKLGAGIDTRGDGGYIVAAGSVIDGKKYYFDDHQLKIVPVPAWIAELRPPVALNGKSRTNPISEDHPDDLDWAVHYLASDAPEAVQGAHGHDTLVRVAMTLKDHGIAPATAVDLLDEHWNPRCSPPWELSDLSGQVKSAYRSARNAQGLKTPQAEFTAPKNPCILNPLRPYDIASRPRRQWVFGTLAMRKQVTIIVAPPGMGKSTLTLSLVASKAAGDNLLGIDPIQPGGAALWNNEDNMAEIERRLAAVMQQNELTFPDFKDRLFLNCGEDRPLRIARRKDGKISPLDAEAIIDAIRELNIDLLVVDPLAETHPAKENDNEEMLVVGSIYRDIAQRADCAVVLVHHTRKLDGASSDGHSGNLDSMRGASSLGGLARVVLTFNTMSPRQAKLYGKSEDERGRFVLLETAKANMSAPGSNKMWFERRSVIVANGDAVGVLDPVDLKELIQPDKDDTRLLVAEIELQVRSGHSSLSVIAKRIAETAVTFIGQKENTLYKRVDRLFTAGQAVRSPHGALTMTEGLAVRGKAQKLITFDLFGDIEPVAAPDLLF